MRDFTRFDGAAEYVARRITESGRDAHDLTPESVALAILALKAEGFEEQRLVAPRQLLRRWQNHSTGAVLVDPKEAATYWPTGWAVLAWSGAQGFEKDCHDAAKFLLYVSGTTWQPRLDDPVGHDTTLHGWPWIGGSHSWVQPTAVNLMALAAAGRRDDVRVSQAVALLLNRQLPLAAGLRQYGDLSQHHKALAGGHRLCPHSAPTPCRPRSGRGEPLLPGSDCHCHEGASGASVGDFGSGIVELATRARQ